MNPDFPENPIERRLRDEAEGLLRPVDSGRVGALLQRHHRIRRRRNAWAAMAVAAMLSAAGLGRFLLPSETSDVGPAADGPAARIAAGDQKTDSPPESEAAPPAQTFLLADGRRAIPVVIRAGDGEEIVAAGLLIPGRERELELSELPPAEQSAVRRVLGMPEENEPQGPI